MTAIRGSVDRVSSDKVTGWAYSATSREPLVVQATLADRVVGEGVAELHRPDLAAAGIGDGRYGFDFSFYEPVDAAWLPFVTVAPRGGNVELPRTNISGFVEFFRAVHGRYPGAGRSRSVFGGLWTDRTDALSLLAGRVATGATAADLEPVLRSFINHGYVVVPATTTASGLPMIDMAAISALPRGVALKPHGNPVARSLLERLPNILFRDAPLRVLRAILDDNPLACRSSVLPTSAASFSQPSAVEHLPSPAECLATVSVANNDVAELDVVRGSHMLPEFTADGRSRWVVSEAAAAIELALANGASIETARVGPMDVAVIGPGTLYRVRAPEGTSAVLNWITPARQTPTWLLQAGAEPLHVRHISGAGLIA